jgi:hypothetical protein
MPRSRTFWRSYFGDRNGLAPRDRLQRRRLLRVVAGDLLHVGVGQTDHEARHDGILAIAVRVLGQGAGDVVGVLARQIRVVAGDADPVLAMAGRAQRDLGRRGADRGCARAQRRAAEVAGDVLHVLVGQRGGLLVHGAVRALAALVFLERGQDVLGVLAHELGHAVGRIDVLVILDAVTAEAGVGDLLAAGRIPGAARLRTQAQSNANTQGMEHQTTRQRHTDSGEI